MNFFSCALNDRKWVKCFKVYCKNLTSVTCLSTV
uniref:Uncharacterized protein n=1 Tax=Anguilla anguilla TaxID=7936 RepID=A0A0E9QGT9_ANGAN